MELMKTIGEMIIAIGLFLSLVAIVGIGLTVTWGAFIWTVREAIRYIKKN